MREPDDTLQRLVEAVGGRCEPTVIAQHHTTTHQRVRQAHVGVAAAAVAALDVDRTVQQRGRARVLAGSGMRLAQRGHRLHGQRFVAHLLGFHQRPFAVRDGHARLAQCVVHAAQPVPRARHAQRIAVAFGQCHCALGQLDLAALGIEHAHHGQALHDVHPAQRPLAGKLAALERSQCLSLIHI